MSMDNRQEIINVLDMREHMVFRNRRTPRGMAEGESSRHSHKDCAQNKSAKREGAAAAQLQQQVWKSDREQ